ncbi:hypothetical protein Tco_1116205, partial [Tanacetum coccineum]
GIGVGGSPRCQEATRGSIAQTRSKRVPTQAHDSPLLRVNILGSDEGSMQLKELMVKKLEKTIKSNQARRRAKIMVSDDEEDLEDSSKHSQEINLKISWESLVQLSTASRLFSTAEESVSTAGASMPVSIAGTVQEANKNKAVRLQEQLDEEERQRIARVHEEASSFNIE